LIPMAVSLAFGVLFATGVILFLVPCAYLVLEDIGGVLGWIKRLYSSERPPVQELPEALDA